MVSVRLKRSDPPADGRSMSDDEARTLVATATWYHTFQLRPGVISPGQVEFDAPAALDALGVPQDLRGKKVLDVGAWDGPMTFEMERRGAQAYALDIQDPTRVGFAIARQVIGSHAVHHEGSVYALPQDDLSDFDHIVFRGVYYHLKYPLLAFECLSAALKQGGLLHFEGEAFLRYAETLAGEPILDDGPPPKRWGRKPADTSWLRKIAESDIPVCLSYPNTYKGASNWFVPNAACLRSWLEATGFDVVEMTPWIGGDTGQRLYGQARKVREASRLEHPLY